MKGHAEGGNLQIHERSGMLNYTLPENISKSRPERKFFRQNNYNDGKRS